MKSRHVKDHILLTASAFALVSCGSLVAESRTSANRERATADGAITKAPPQLSVPKISTPVANDRTCVMELAAAGARFTPVPDTHEAPGCNKLGTVQLSAIAGDGSFFAVSNIGALSCPVARAFSNWTRFGVDRAARQILGSPLSRVETMGSYACRNVAGTERLSAHARAEAIDVSGFVLEDGRRIDLKRDWYGGPPAVREFLRVVHSSACKRFGSVLGPAFNDAHADHFHLEGTGPKFCR